MSDEQTQADASTEAAGDKTSEDSQSETKENQDQKGSEGSGEDTKSDADAGDKAGEDAGAGDKKPEQKEFQPQSRRSAAYRIQQLAKENKALKDQLAGKGEKKDEGNDGWKEDDRQDDKPDIASLVAQEVEKRLNPVLSQTSEVADNGEINELFTGDRAGERTKYEGKIREMWKLSQYKDVAALDLYKILTYDEAMARGATAVKEADKEAKKSSTGGHSARGKGGEKTAWDLSEKEFKDKMTKLRSGQA